MSGRRSWAWAGGLLPPIYRVHQHPQAQGAVRALPADRNPRPNQRREATVTAGPEEAAATAPSAVVPPRVWVWVWAAEEAEGLRRGGSGGRGRSAGWSARLGGGGCKACERGAGALGPRAGGAGAAGRGLGLRVQQPAGVAVRAHDAGGGPGPRAPGAVVVAAGGCSEAAGSRRREAPGSGHSVRGGASRPRPPAPGPMH